MRTFSSPGLPPGELLISASAVSHCGSVYTGYSVGGTVALADDGLYLRGEVDRETNSLCSCANELHEKASHIFYIPIIFHLSHHSLGQWGTLVGNFQHCYNVCKETM